MSDQIKKIFVVIPAYNAGATIKGVFARIPRDFLMSVKEYIVVNDGSTDNTMTIVCELQKIYPNITLLNKEKNEGYAKAQKSGFRLAIDKGADIVVLLHSDGQYAPEELSRLAQPLIVDEVDIVQGSRMLAGGALKGGMPFYKYLANKFLSKLENWCYGMNLAEYHSGYMLYSRRALVTIPFEKLSNTFHFDGEMLFVGHDYGLRIKELSIPTRYAEEKSHLQPIRYGLDVLKIMWQYKQGKYNFSNKSK